ncbi:HAMP domain-containing protein [Butyrivibrio sp. X503]|uniref:sensor histidine kinase n=1 Tax=Butyrivibrio sp. X503 TaxID=2364878 RepID=UPI000EA9036A|nr:histidine kinase [Butyrivibrio sp. X503]RKM55237.1 HAMP domain-containing protein [Butyrivibrio sp. X503]
MFKNLKHRILFKGNLKKHMRIMLALMLTGYLGVSMLFFCIVLQHRLIPYYRSVNEDALETAKISCEKVFENLSSLSKIIMFSDEITAYLTDNNSSHYAHTKEAIRYMYLCTNYYDKIDSVYVFKTNGEYVNINTSFGHVRVDRDKVKNTDWIKDITSLGGGYRVLTDKNGLFIRKDREFFTFIRAINDLETLRPIGVIAINCPLSLLESAVGDSEDLALFDSNGNVFFGEEFSKQFIGEHLSELVEGNDDGNVHALDKYSTATASIANSDLFLIKKMAISVVSQMQREIIWLLVILLILAVVFMYAMNMYMRIIVIRPLEKLSETMDKVKDGYMHRAGLTTQVDEINILKDSYNNMIIKINDLILELVEQEKVLAQSRLDVLVEQINPHFLYNTLETLGYMSLESDRKEVYEAIVSLGDFYRIFLNSGEEMTTVELELEMIQNYLKLQKLRYDDLFEDYYDINPRVLNIHIPKLILQPLVENSLYHGLRKKDEKGVIRITADFEDNNLALTIYDSGIGMTEEEIEKVIHTDTGGFGLYKTLQRLSYLYKSENLYRIESVKGEFFKITLLLPYDKC